jgi:hypothetical protein
MKDFNLFEDSLVLNPDKNYHLSIEMSQKGLIFSILDLDDKKYLGLKHISLNGESEENIKNSLDQIFENEDILQHKFSSSAIMYSSFRSMLVPESFFNDQNLKTFLKFHHEVDEKDHILYHHLKSAEGFLIFTIPSYIEDYFTEKLSNVKFYHHCIPFISNNLRYSKATDNTPKICINLAEDFFDILIIRNAKILLFNSFFYKKYSDVLYFLINILNLFSLKPDIVKLVLIGNIDKEAEIEKEIKGLFKNFTFENYNTDFTYTAQFNEIESHRFVNLLNLYHCVL